MPILSNEQFTKLPPNEQKYYAEMMAQADQIRKAQNVAYPDNQRIAPFPQELKDAQERTNRDFGIERGTLQRAENSIEQGMRPFHRNYREYMNPYQENVVRQLSEEGNRNFTENILPALEARFLRLGQHGGSKHADLSLRAARDFQRELLSRQQQALSSGYQQAGQMYNAQQLRELEGANQLSNLATTRQGNRFSDIAALEAIGKYKQQQDQSMLDARYQEWLRQRDDPQQRLAFQAAMMQGMPSQGVNQAYYQTPAPQQMNMAGQFGPLAVGLLGTRMMGAGR
jgi:hypothetical protein